MRNLRRKAERTRTLKIAAALWTPFSLGLFMLWSLGGCSSIKTFEIESRPPEHQIAIDGKADEWAGRLFSVEGQKIALGFLNDRDYLYICLRTGDAAMERQILRSGLTVWIDAKGARNKVLGIKYPVGLRPDEQRMMKEGEPEEAEAPGGIEGNLTDVEIYRQGSPQPEALDIADAKGIEIKAATAGRILVYELKVPLVQSGPDSIGVGAAPGGTVGVGFETGKYDMNNLPSRSPGGLMGGTASQPPIGGYGSRGGMKPGQLRPNAPALPENLTIWATVKLSSAGHPEPAKVQSLSE